MPLLPRDSYAREHPFCSNLAIVSYVMHAHTSTLHNLEIKLIFPRRKIEVSFIINESIFRAVPGEEKLYPDL